MTIKRLLLFIILILAVVGAGAFAWATRHPEIAQITPPEPSSFSADLVERGELLAGMGNCHVCHTAKGGKPYAGGLALPTPFGIIYTTNITPDAEAGIGAWSEEAFVRAMRQGVDRKGEHLYPAFPYDFYAKVTNEDLGAIYAYLMTREPVAEKAPETKLPFPFNMRLSLAGWNLLFHDSTPFQADPAKDEEWNRGAYLVEGLGHCGACHSPRNAFGAAARSGTAAYSGGEAEGWHVPALNGTSASPIPWTQDALVNYLIDGWDKNHGIAGGPMRPIVDDLYDQSEDDVFAIAAYLMSLNTAALPEADQKAREDAARAFATKVEWGSPDSPPVPEDPLLQQGARVFESQCVSCHKAGGNPAPLALTASVNAPDSGNLIRVVLNGVQPPRGSSDRSMPGRAMQINDADMAALAAFVRARFTTHPAWQDVAKEAAEARAELAH